MVSVLVAKPLGAKQEQQLKVDQFFQTIVANGSELNDIRWESNGIRKIFEKRVATRIDFKTSF